MFMAVLIALLFLTFITVAVSRFDFGSAALEPGILMLTNVALRALDQLAQ